MYKYKHSMFFKVVHVLILYVGFFMCTNHFKRNFHLFRKDSCSDSYYDVHCLNVKRQ